MTHPKNIIHNSWRHNSVDKTHMTVCPARMENGFYWVIDKSNNEITIAFYNEKNPTYPWHIVASDEFYKLDEFEVIEKINPPKQA